LLKDVYPLKAQYSSEELIELAIEIMNHNASSVNWMVEVRVGLLNEEVERLACEIHLVGHEKRTIIVKLAGKQAEFNGYGADVALYDHGLRVHEISTAFDVVANWRKVPRYGFLSDFHPAESGIAADVQYLNKLHINLVQFYDWMYRHEQLIPPQSEFKDLMGRDLSLDVVKEKIALCHEHGMKAVAYGAVYAASEIFYELHPDWALYDSNGNVENLIGLFYIMNISAESPWPKHIVAQYRRAIEEVGFDGIHMDTYGAPKTAISRLNGIPKLEILKEQFPLLINETRDELGKCNPNVALIFNNVGNWPVDTVALAKQDAIYIEVWPPYERYHHIQQIIQQAKHASRGKPVIVAAYLQPFRTLPAEMARAYYSTLLLTAVIAANGGSHLLHGENQGVLTQAYYADYSTLNDAEFVRKVRNYYDFIVRFANLLYDDSLEDVSMTHTGWDNLEYVFNDFAWSSYGEAGKVWTTIRENSRFKTISLINLTNNSEDFWNEGKNCPTMLHRLKLSILINGPVNSVFTASPDINMGRPCTLDFAIIEGPKGKVLQVEVPHLHIWSLVVIQLPTSLYS